MNTPVMLASELPALKLLARGKVRDIYDLGDLLLIVATDRISAFDVVMPNGVPGKGAILNQLSAYWFQQTRHLGRNHLVTTDVSEYPATARQYAEQLAGRSMLVRKAQRVDVECIVRGYLAGSAWSEYRRQGTVCGQPLPHGLQESGLLPEPIFTPSTKASAGHDENISIAELENLVGKELAQALAVRCLEIYRWARDRARERGIIIADTKMELGFIDGELSIIDELFTPDSSRFWDAQSYQPGRSQASFDKQPLRDWLESTGWNKQPPAPFMPPEVVAGTTERYITAYRRLVGSEPIL